MKPLIFLAAAAVGANPPRPGGVPRPPAAVQAQPPSRFDVNILDRTPAGVALQSVASELRRHEEEQLAAARLKQERLDAFGDLLSPDKQKINVPKLDTADPEVEPIAIIALLNSQPDLKSLPNRQRTKVTDSATFTDLKGRVTASGSGSYTVFDDKARLAYVQEWEASRDQFANELAQRLRDELTDRLDNSSRKETILRDYERIWKWQNDRQKKDALRKFAGKWAEEIRALAPDHKKKVAAEKAKQEAEWNAKKRQFDELTSKIR